MVLRQFFSRSVEHTNQKRFVLVASDGGFGGGGERRRRSYLFPLSNCQALEAGMDREGRAGSGWELGRCEERLAVVVALSSFRCCYCWPVS